MVSFPVLFRPPLFFTVFTSDFNGLDAVISSNDDASLCLEPGVTGLSFFNAMVYKSRLYVAIKINDFSFRKGHDRLLVIRTAATLDASLGVPHFQFAHHVERIHTLHVHTILLFHCLLDLYLVGVKVDNKAVPALFVEGRHFFRYQGLLQDAHCALFNKLTTLSIELSTKINLSAFITSYVLILSAVVIFARRMFLPDKVMFLLDSGRISNV